jgi:hypothetical protein
VNLLQNPAQLRPQIIVDPNPAAAKRRTIQEPISPIEPVTKPCS